MDMAAYRPQRIKKQKGNRIMSCAAKNTDSHTIAVRAWRWMPGLIRGFHATCSPQQPVDACAHSMNRKQQISVSLAGLAFVILCLFPPWHHVARVQEYSVRPKQDFGFWWLLDTTQGEPSFWVRDGHVRLQIAWGHLALLALVVLVAAAFAYVHYKVAGAQAQARNTQRTETFAEITARMRAQSKTPQAQPQTPPVQSQTPPARHSWLQKFLALVHRYPRAAFFAGIAGVFGIASLVQNSRPRQPYAPNPPGYRSSSTPRPNRSAYTRPSTAPNGTAWPQFASYITGELRLQDDGLSSVTVDNTLNDSDVFLKLVSLDLPQAYPVRVCFIPKHSQFQFEKVTQGRYDVRYRNLATGRILKSQLFTLNETPTQSGTKFDKFSLTLYTVLNGNTHTETIDESQF